MNSFSSRRVFINKKFHLFTFTQEKDGSIYCSWPNFTSTKWVICKDSAEGTVAIETSTPNNGKFTIHGSGMTGFRGHGDKYDNSIIFYGNPLVNEEKTSIGLRHLFTFQMQEPKNVPENSPYMNRKSDYNINATQICPLILVCFAFPNHNFNFECNFTMHKDFIPWNEKNEPTHYLGSDVIELKDHVIVWIAYRTINMFWPTDSYVFYNNGYKVPVITGLGNKKYSCELRNPTYSQNGNKIKIDI